MPPRRVLSQADTILLQFEIPLATVYHTIHFAKSHWHSLHRESRPRPASGFQGSCRGRLLRAQRERGGSHHGHSRSHPRRCKEMRELFARAGALPRCYYLGERGSLLATSEGLELIPAFKVDPIDSTGAGDAFIGSFAVFLAEGLTDKEALTRASLYAALSTTRVGTQKSFPSREEFDKQWRDRGTGA